VARNGGYVNRRRRRGGSNKIPTRAWRWHQHRGNLGVTPISLTSAAAISGGGVIVSANGAQRHHQCISNNAAAKKSAFVSANQPISMWRPISVASAMALALA